MARGVKRTKSIALEDWPSPLQQEWQTAMTNPNIPDGNGGFLPIVTDAQMRNIRHATEMYIKFQTDCGIPLETSLRDRFADPASIIVFYAVTREDEDENSRSQTGRRRSSLDCVDRLHSVRLRILAGERDPLFEEWLRETRDECSARGKILVAPIDIPPCSGWRRTAWTPLWAHQVWRCADRALPGLPDSPHRWFPGPLPGPPSVGDQHEEEPPACPGVLSPCRFPF